MSNLKIGVLGPLQVTIADMPVTAFESVKVSALLAYLAVESDHPHRRETLVGLLWPDQTDESARHNLRQALSNLRSVLGDRGSASPYLIATRDTIQFNRDSDYSLDLDQFKYHYYTCEEHENRCPEDCPSRASHLELIVDLYRGNFLEHVYINDSSEFEEWILMKRESLRQLILEAHSYLANYYELHGEFQPAQRHTRRQLELDPWREEAHRQLMRVLAFDGKRSTALEQFEICKQVLAEELDVEPSPETYELYEQIKLGKIAARASGVGTDRSKPTNNLPIQLTPFIGRETELAELGRQLGDPECRCITLVGPGGIGKTRLAIQAAGAQSNRFANGVAFIPLAPINSTPGVVPAIASAINAVFISTNDPEADLVSYLRGKHMLLVLDNVEHLLRETDTPDDLIRLLVHILLDAQGIKLIVTTRQALNIQEEWLFEVNGLTYPAGQEDISSIEYDAINLFVQRARRSSPGYIFSEEDYSEVANICRMVEGMPLAIELAATWARVLSPAEIASEIENSLDILSASLRDLPERHRNMRIVFEHSWQMLTVEERAVLSKLSVFRGGFGRKAAEQVAGSTLTILSTLVSRTMIRRTSAGRYDLHELVRQYSAEQLAADSGVCEDTHARHFDYFREMAEIAEKELHDSNQLEWLTRLDQEHDNLSAAFDWALAEDISRTGEGNKALQLSASLRWFWQMRGYFHEGIDWLTKALEKKPGNQSESRGNALLGMGLLLNGLGELEKASQYTRESIQIIKIHGEPSQLAEALLLEGAILLWQGEASRGKAELEEALSIFRKAGDRWGEAFSCRTLGSYLADYSGDPAGRDLLEQSAAILNQLGEKYLLSGVQIILGIVETSLGNYAAAEQHFNDGLVITREIRHPWGIADALTNLGCLFRIKGQYAAAQSQFEQALKIYHEIGRNNWEVDPFCAMAENAIAQGDLANARQYLQTAAGFISSPENRWLDLLIRYFQGLLAFYEGDLGKAEELLEATTRKARETHFRSDLARAIVSLGHVKISTGNIEPAHTLLIEGLSLYRKIGNRLGMAIALEGLAKVYSAQSDEKKALKWFAIAQRLRELIGAPIPPVDRPYYDAFLADCRNKLGVSFEKIWSDWSACPAEVLVQETSAIPDPA